ncbi:MAG: guanylate kinase [Chitinophagaceae bacterium]
MNKIIILTAPSGGGKTSIMRHLMARFPNQLAFSISAATRKPRGAEKDGIDYYFITAETFKQKIEEQAFVEWEMVYEGKYYGTLKSELHRIWAEGKVPILDIDVKGAIHIQEQFPGQVLSLFIQPPSVEELRRRLEARGTETPESLEARISKASYELSFSHEFSKIIVNDKLEKACEEAEEVVGQFISSQFA